MGMLAAQTVLQQIGAPASTIHAQQIVVDPEFVVRESTSPASVAARGRKKRGSPSVGPRAALAPWLQTFEAIEVRRPRQVVIASQLLVVRPSLGHAIPCHHGQPSVAL